MFISLKLSRKRISIKSKINPLRLFNKPLNTKFRFMNLSTTLFRDFKTVQNLKKNNPSKKNQSRSIPCHWLLLMKLRTLLLIRSNQLILKRVHKKSHKKANKKVPTIKISKRNSIPKSRNLILISLLKEISLLLQKAKQANKKYKNPRKN